MNKTIYNSIILNNTQVGYLIRGTAGIDRMKCFYRLVDMVMKQIGNSSELDRDSPLLWQIDMSEVALARLWKCDRKTVSKILDAMQELGILSSVQTRRGSVHTLLCISAWVVDDVRYNNPFYVPISKRSIKTDTNVLASPTGNAGVSTNATSSDSAATTDENITNVVVASQADDGSEQRDRSTEQTSPSSPLPFPSCSSRDEDIPVSEPTTEEMEMEQEARHFFDEVESEKGLLAFPNDHSTHQKQPLGDSETTSSQSAVHEASDTENDGLTTEKSALGEGNNAVTE